MTMFIVNNMVMIRININEAKTHLSRYLVKVAQGERILLCKRNVPVAEIRAIEEPPAKRRPIGLHKGMVAIPPSFFEPLPPDILDAFNGEG